MRGDCHFIFAAGAPFIGRLRFCNKLIVPPRSKHQEEKGGVEK
jgi:hypothetical protein